MTTRKILEARDYSNPNNRRLGDIHDLRRQVAEYQETLLSKSSKVNNLNPDINLADYVNIDGVTLIAKDEF